MSQLIAKHSYKKFLSLERQITSNRNAMLKTLTPRVQLKTMPHEVKVTGSSLLHLTP